MEEITGCCRRER